MIVIKVELWSAVSGAKTELAMPFHTLTQHGREIRAAFLSYERNVA